MAPRTNGRDEKTGVDILEDRQPKEDDAFFDQLQSEMRRDPVAEAHVENGPVVMLNVTAMRQPWGHDCVEVYFPDPARDVQKLTVAEADGLERDLAVAKAAAGHHRSMQGSQL